MKSLGLAGMHDKQGAGRGQLPRLTLIDLYEHGHVYRGSESEKHQWEFADPDMKSVIPL